MIETSPRTEGRKAIMSGMKDFLARTKNARFEVLRSTVMGNTVMNDRIDHFEMEDKKLAFHISGVFLVIDGKIKEWQDYTWPKVDGKEESSS